MRASHQRVHADAEHTAASKTELAQYLAFSVSHAELAVSLEHVTEILSYERVSPVPGTPAWVRGVIHLRGAMVPVLDLACKLGLSPGSATKRTSILMLRVQASDAAVSLGVVVDGVATLFEAAHGEIRPAPSFGGDVDTRYLQGIVPVGERFVPLIDVARLFGAAALAASAGALAEVSR